MVSIQLLFLNMNIPFKTFDRGDQILWWPKDKRLQLTDDIKLDLGVLGLLLAWTLPVARDAPQIRPVHPGHEVLADVEAEVAVGAEAEHQRAAVLLHQLKAHGGGGLHLLANTHNGHGFGDLWSSDIIGQAEREESKSWEIFKKKRF